MLSEDVVGMDKTITVVGTGISHAEPDAAVVNGEITGTVGDYSEAVGASAEALTSLRKSIGDAGFDMDDLRTTSFSVDTVYRSGPSGEPEFIGYRYMHGISITTEANGETLGRLLQAMIASEGAPEFRVSYIVRDRTGRGSWPRPPASGWGTSSPSRTRRRSVHRLPGRVSWQPWLSMRSRETWSSVIPSPCSGRSSEKFLSGCGPGRHGDESGIHPLIPKVSASEIPRSSPTSRTIRSRAATVLTPVISST